MSLPGLNNLLNNHRLTHQCGHIQERKTMLNNAPNSSTVDPAPQPNAAAPNFPVPGAPAPSYSMPGPYGAVYVPSQPCRSACGDGVRNRRDGIGRPIIPIHDELAWCGVL